MISITSRVRIPESEVEFTAIRSSGPGGQNVNKVASAIQLRWNIHSSSIPYFYKNKILKYKDQRITQEGVVVIKAQVHRTQDKNKTEAIARLADLIAKATYVAPPRRETQPTKASQRKRTDTKTKRGQTKALRKKVNWD